MWREHWLYGSKDISYTRMKKNERGIADGGRRRACSKELSGDTGELFATRRSHLFFLNPGARVTKRCGSANCWRSCSLLSSIELTVSGAVGPTIRDPVQD